MMLYIIRLLPMSARVCVCVCVCVCGVFVRVCCIVNFCYLIIRNAEALLAEIESRDRHYKRILVLLRAHG